MISSLEIRNYRNLHHLTIKKLGRVNLLVGKNNTGKTSVLEAVAIYINHGNIEYLLQLLEERGENYIRRNTDRLNEGSAIRTLSALFIDRKPRFLEDSSIIIAELENTLFGFSPSLALRVSLKFVKYLDEFEDVGLNQPLKRRRVYIEDQIDEPDAQIGLEIKFGKASALIPIRSLDRSNRGLSVNGIFSDITENHQFIRTKNIDRDINGSLWDRISLTESEDEVVKALRIIEKDIDRVTFRNERPQERVAVVKLKSLSDVIPLRSMGDGINRILTIILAMVNCENGYLLIDEFENGLHYSVQEKLWEVVFQLADRLNIQVFATTHSSDTINSFEAVANSSSVYKDAQLIRLRNSKGEISAVTFNAQELQIANESEYLDLR